MNRNQGKQHLYWATTSWGRMREKFFAVLKSDEATQRDEVIEKLAPELSSSEICRHV
jgi:hypothetical protein